MDKKSYDLKDEVNTLRMSVKNVTDPPKLRIYIMTLWETMNIMMFNQQVSDSYDRSSIILNIFFVAKDIYENPLNRFLLWYLF